MTLHHTVVEYLATSYTFTVVCVVYTSYLLVCLCVWQIYIMITIQAYRAIIGLFFQKARCISPQNHNLETRRNCRYFDTVYFLSTFVVIFIGIVMYCNLNLGFLKLLRLMCDGDIESNPGSTYSILKIVKGSYHQGNLRFGSTAGNQCTCNSLFALTWSMLRKVAIWKCIWFRLYPRQWRFSV